jgi:hypothetical protein
MKNILAPAKYIFTPPFQPLPDGRIPYLVDENRRFRPAIGYGILPPPPRVIQRLDQDEPGDQEATGIEQFLFDRYANNIKDLDESAAVGLPYVHIKMQTPISIPGEVPKFDLEDEINRSKRCRKAAAVLLEPKTTDIYYSVLHCMKFWCERCGGKRGFLHKRRKGYTYRKINRGRLPKGKEEIIAASDGWNVRQFVFTVPEKDRYLFHSWDGLNKLSGVVRRVIRDSFPGSRVQAAIQLTGDKNLLKFHPHVHVLIFYRKGEIGRARLAPAVLDAIKNRYARGLRRLGCSGVRGPDEEINGKRVDVHYNFATTPAQVLHLINYITRPMSQAHLEAWQGSEAGQGMIDLCVQELKGFQYLRNWDRWAGCNYYDFEDAVRETASVIGSPVIFAGSVPIERINELIVAGQVKKVGDDLYRQPGRLLADYLPRGWIINLKEGVNYASDFDRA